MSIYDSIYDQTYTEYQSRALGKMMRSYCLGDTLPIPMSMSHCQIPVFGKVTGDDFATIRDASLVEVPADRDQTLPLITTCDVQMVVHIGVDVDNLNVALARAEHRINTLRPEPTYVAMWSSGDFYW